MYGRIQKESKLFARLSVERQKLHGAKITLYTGAFAQWQP